MAADEAILTLRQPHLSRQNLTNLVQLAILLMENLQLSNLFLEFTLSDLKMNWKEILQSNLGTLMPRYIIYYGRRNYFTSIVKDADAKTSLFMATFRFINLMMQVVLGQNAINFPWVKVEVVHLMSFLQTFQGPKETSNLSGDYFYAKQFFFCFVLIELFNRDFKLGLASLPKR
ncbi:PREDICTED: uncharacterized protein LOC102775513 isoform X1 [Myotis davidii]|uniref:uncharacterized protein LOC102775513 isoform X1 n=1 Tax=Myotis davidii TaxID=225400 RepID=UPI000767D9B1|nr:PREDICTED: uncharacterized protein LOC102775513 isoform X1 [Myotis davidii]